MGHDCYLPNSEIGRFCSIGNNVQVISETHPTKGFLSTHPAFYSLGKQCGTTFTTRQLFNERLTIRGRNCIIGNDVWIGNDVKIKGGLKIGDGAILGLGSIITKDVPPFAIVAGIPARIIRYRFPKEKIEEILVNPWWHWSDNKIKRMNPYE